jgi:nucleoside-diphosphate-sugar epimerase
MKILFTGGSSFTGYWFARELASQGHDVFAVFRRQPHEYDNELRRQRIEAVAKVTQPIYGTSFGDDKFIQLVRAVRFDVLCHHGAEAADYRSPHFDVLAAVGSNSRELQGVLALLKETGCTRIVLTGSVFENDEGFGSSPEAFSPYGLSKALTWQIFRYYARTHQASLGKFVIPNPFGPFEEPRFTYYLIKNWFSGNLPTVNTPEYVRDNIHVSLLAKVYARFVVEQPTGLSRINPSGYVESQEAFARRFGRELGPRLGLKCAIETKAQTDFSEPRLRINRDVAAAAVQDFNEQRAWDELADYYRHLMTASG